MHGIFKVVFMGEGGVGKTSLLRRHTDGWFSLDMKLTVGVDFAVRQVTYGDWQATLQIWDLGGQMRFRDLAKIYFSGARAAIAVFDISSRFTMERLHDWIMGLFESEGQIPLLIVGNKIDLRGQLPSTYPLITTEEGQTLAEYYNAPYIETSARNGIGIETIFSEIARILSECFPHPELGIPARTSEGRSQAALIFSEE